MTNPDATTVLYIGGMGRSGSTLLEYLLGQIDGYFAGGELKYIWRNGIHDNELCGCGQPFDECPFWREVGEVAFGGWSTIDVDDVLALQAHATESRAVLALLSGAKPGADWVRYAELLRALYSGIRAVSGCHAVVDASKTPVEALLLARVPGIDCRVLHLVRDSRGVAFSWAKRGVRLPQVTDRHATMLHYRPAYIAPRWVYANLFFDLLRIRIPTALVRYEDVVRAPREQVESALRRCGAPTDGLDVSVLDTKSVRLGTLHTLGGNPMRFQKGDTSIRADEAWRREMALPDRRVVVAVSWPLLLRYGYLRRRRPDVGRGVGGDR